MHLRSTFGPWSDSPLGYFLAAYGSQRRLGTTPNDISQILSHPRLSRVATLFYESATLQDAVQWLKDIHTRALEKREGAEQLKSDVLRLLNDGLLPDGSHIDRVDSDGLWVTRDNVTLPLQEISDGYRAVTSLVLDLVGHLSKTFPKLGFSEVNGAWVCPQPGVVLIDEVDAHLHVEWQRRIGFWLTQHFPRIQFLVTTHSPFICQAASPKGLIRLPAPGEERKIEHVSDDIWREVVNGGVDDAVMSELFGLDSAMSDRAEDLRNELAELEAKILDGVATEADRALYRRNKARLPNDPGTLAEHQLRTLHKRADKR